MPDFPIIDAHVHLYDPAAVSYPWMEGAPALNRPHLPADFRARSAGAEVEALVFVEVDAGPGQHLREAEWVARLAAATPALRAITASAPLEAGEAARADLAALAKIPLVRAVRRLIQGHVDEPGWCLRQPFVDGVRMLAEFDLGFEICILHPQLGDAVELVRRCPQVRFVLDHIGKPGVRDRLTEPWRSRMRDLAALPNVVCKISGAVTEADHANWTEAEVAPYVAHAIDCFGFDRVMFGGDWPVLELATTYGRWVEIVDRVVAGAAEADRRKLYRDTAAAFYRI